MPVAYLSTQFNDTQFKWSTLVKEGFAIYHAIKKWRHYLEDAEVLLKSDAKSLQKFLNGKTNNLKLDRWSLELQGRNIQVEHILSYKNKAADCLSRLPFVTRKRNDNPSKMKTYPSMLFKQKMTLLLVHYVKLIPLTPTHYSTKISIALE